MLAGSRPHLVAALQLLLRTAVALLGRRRPKREHDRHRQRHRNETEGYQRRNLVNITAEQVLLNLMGEATTIADTIRVQNQLERVQENIERMRGRLRVLEDQTSFSTLAVDVIEEGAKEEDPEEAGTLIKAWRDAVDGFMGVVSGVIVASGVLLPIAVMALIVALLVRRMRPRFERGPEPEVQT